MKKEIFCLALAISLAWGVDAFGARATRDLVFEDNEETSAEESASATQTLGVKATALLERDGQKSAVTPTHEFKSGDKVKLVFTPNADGYAYWLAKGTSGKYTMLYPNPTSGMDNSVKRNNEYTIPAKGAFRFDDTPGNEELLRILSAEKLEDLDKAAAEQFANAGPTVAEMERNHPKKRATRDLFFEEDDEEDVQTKTQSAPKGEPFVAPFVLKHN